MSTRPLAIVGPGQRPGPVASAPRTRSELASPAPPRPGDPDSEWRTWDADLPATTAAIKAFSRGLELQDRSSDTQLHWHHDATDLELWVDITAVPRAGGSEVGIRIRPAGRPPGRWLIGNGLLYVAAVAAAILGVALLLVPGGDIQVLLLIALIDLVFMLSLVFPLVVIPARRLARAQVEWARRWRVSFWAGLEARLAQRALYR